MKTRVIYTAVIILLISFIDISAMDPLPTKLTALKVGLGKLQKKTQELKDKLEDLKNKLQAPPVKQQASTETGWFESLSNWFGQYLPSSPMSPHDYRAKDPSVDVTDKLGWPITLRYLGDQPKKTTPLGTGYTPPPKIPTAPIPPLPSHSGFSFGFKIGSIRDLPSEPPQFAPKTFAYLIKLSSEGWKKLLQPKSLAIDIVTHENNILNTYEFYQFPNFIEYARTLNAYDEYMLKLNAKIKSDDVFAYQLKTNVPGFSFGGNLFIRQWSDFHNLIEKETDKIINKRCTQFGCLDVSNVEYIMSLAEEYLKVNHDMPPKSYNKDRRKKRLKALNKVISNAGQRIDYSMQVPHPVFTDIYAPVFDHCCGTLLDKQIHEELCQTRSMMLDLQAKHPGSPHVQSYTPMVNRITALAKKEQNIQKAFNLSDFAYDLTNIVTSGVQLLGNIAATVAQSTSKVASGAAKKVLDLERWINIPSGILSLGVLLVDEMAALDNLDRSVAVSVFTSNPDPIFAHGAQYQKNHEANALALQVSVDKLMKMPLKDLAEHGAELALTIVLDAVIFKSASLFACKTGRVLTTNIAKVLNSPESSLAMTEIAAVGKVALEEGAEITAQSIDIIKNNTVLWSSKGKPASQAVREVIYDCRWTMPEKGKMIDGRWYTIHALERMAPDTIQVRAILESRALKQGLKPGMPKYASYVDPRGIPPMVVEDAIQNGTRKIGEKIGTLEITGPSITVIIGETSGNVITIYPK